MRRSTLVLFFLVILVSSSLLAQSQATTGVIEGVVTDPSGAALPGVTVTLRNLETNYTQTLVTDSGGRYRGALLPLGRYEVTASLEGFANRVVRGLELSVGQTLRADIPLSQAAIAEQIVVTAQAPLIETARTEGSTRIDQKAVEGLPNN